MSRTLKVLVVFMVLAISGNAADLVSMKLCADKDYGASTKACAPGKALEGSGIVIDPGAVKAVNLLTAVKGSKGEEIYHVWIFNGKGGGKPIVFDSTIKTVRDADQTDLDWLKERKIEGARVIVRLSVSPSPNYRTRSQKTLGPGSAGPWKVQVYDSTNLSPLGEMTFAVTPSDKGITNE
ncbi:MAG: hypothetical protein DMG11_24830 [Acidobacteria bacterium]|nr:MAG: hypothetical protein DMG11_24830 [Acidobacteriota bacterium]